MSRTHSFSSPASSSTFFASARNCVATFFQSTPFCLSSAPAFFSSSVSRKSTSFAQLAFAGASFASAAGARAVAAHASASAVATPSAWIDLPTPFIVPQTASANEMPATSGGWPPPIERGRCLCLVPSQSDPLLEPLPVGDRELPRAAAPALFGRRDEGSVRPGREAADLERAVLQLEEFPVEQDRRGDGLVVPVDDFQREPPAPPSKLVLARSVDARDQRHETVGLGADHGAAHLERAPERERRLAAGF